MDTPAANGQLALLLEVAGTPKPGNVDRDRDLPGLRFEHFLAGAVGAGGGLRAAADGTPVGEAFERAVGGMAGQRGENTQFGALLLLVPLVAAADEGGVDPDDVSAVVENTSVADAAGFYRAFDHVDVAVDDPPAEGSAPDVRRGSDAVADLREQEMTLYDVMAESASRDGVAREWVEGFERTFGAAEYLAAGRGPASDLAAETFLWLLSREPDTLVATKHGERTARRVMVRAQEARADTIEHVEVLAESLVAEGINPGTTADLTAAALFVALQRGDLVL
jgi:triphosphoribosyl-dephospho-CoA synthase